MRIRPGTYIAAGARLGAVALALAGIAGCGGDKKEERASQGPLTVYLSVPRHGVDAAAGAAVAAGARLALADAGGRAGGRAVRIVELDDSKPGGRAWNPDAVEANAKRAARDPATIAYLGELDEGASAISVPVTNDAGILQVSPADGLTTLTRDQPGAPVGTGPARYYPSGKRTFVRLVPTDALQAAELVRWARRQGVRRLAVVQDDEVFGRVLAEQVVNAAARARLAVTVVVERGDEPADFTELTRKLGQQRPDAVVYTGIGDAPAGALLAAIHRALPGARLFGSSALAGAVPAPAGMPAVQVLSPLLPVSEYGPQARRLHARLATAPAPAIGSEALYGYEAMRVVLDAVTAVAPHAGDRTAVARAALTAGSRRSAIGDYRVLPSGETSTARFGAYRRSATELRYLGQRMATR